VHPVGFVAVALFAEGFVLLAALPVVLDWSELHTGPERAGAAVGFLLLAGNLGGVVLVLVVQGVIGNPYLSLGALSVAGLAGLALSTRLPARLADTPGAASPAPASTGAGSPAPDSPAAHSAGPPATGRAPRMSGRGSARCPRACSGRDTPVPPPRGSARSPPAGPTASCWA